MKVYQKILLALVVIILIHPQLTTGHELYTPHLAVVVSKIEDGTYTYLEVDESGERFGVAIKKASVAVGETIEFPDTPPLENFASKTVNRTFETIRFVPVFRRTSK